MYDGRPDEEEPFMGLRRLVVRIAIASTLAAALVPYAGAQNFPARPVRIVAPFPPAGGIDLLARVVAENLSSRWAQPVIVDNRPGGNATIGTDLVAKSAPDGYTLLLTASLHSVMPSLHSNLPFDPIRDFDAVSLLAIGPGILLVHPSVPVNSVKELIAYAKARPGQLNYGSAGFGGSAFLGAELFKLRAGVDIRHIPYKGAAPALTDLIGGQIQVMFGNFAPSLPYALNGRLKALAVTGAQRMPMAPNIPTMMEAGVPDFEMSVWFGLLGPRGMPRTIVTKINRDIAAILQLPSMKKQLETLGFDGAVSTPEELQARVVSEVDKWRRLVKEANLRVE